MEAKVREGAPFSLKVFFDIQSLKSFLLKLHQNFEKITTELKKRFSKKK
jgi:hypothetical protein